MATISRPSEPHDDPKAAAERRLLAERDRLVARQRDGHSPAAPPEAHAQPAEAPVDDVASELEFRSREAIADRLSYVDAALERLRDGTYGDCASCGEAIAPRRLEHDPAASMCVACREAADGTRRRNTL